MMSKRLKRLLPIVMLVNPLLFLLFHTGVTEAMPLTCGSWSVMSSPNVGTGDNYLNGVAAVSNKNIWAVGHYVNSYGFPQTLIEHWNGRRWNIVSSPNVGTSDNQLYSVAVVSNDNIWAVGRYLNIGQGFQTLIEHWDGMSWSVVSSPNPEPRDNELYGIAVISNTNIWAVGYYITGNVTQTLIERWNGTSWSIVSSPNVGSRFNYLLSVAVVSNNNIWAVGYYNTTGNPQTLIEHWDGTSWSIVSTPNHSGSNNLLLSVAAVSNTNIWAVGIYLNINLHFQTLIEHWNGTRWSVVSSPNVGSRFNYLLSVAVVSNTNIWAVGKYFTEKGVAQTLIEHWNGTRWSVVSSPNVGTSDNQLYGVAVSSNNIWAVGYYKNSSQHFQTLTEFYC